MSTHTIILDDQDEQLVVNETKTDIEQYITSIIKNLADVIRSRDVDNKFSKLTYTDKKKALDYIQPP